jgi:hypothetical protein
MVSVISLAVGIAVVGAFLLRSTMSSSTTAQAVPEESYKANYPVLRHSGGFTASTQQDVAAHLNAILQDDDHLARLNNFKLMLAQWVVEDEEAALDYVRTMKSGPERTAGLLIVLNTIGQTDTPRAISLANEMVKDSEQSAIYNSLFANAAAKDVTSALHYFESVPEGVGRDNALLALTSKWAATDVESALKWASGLSDERERQSATEASIDSMMRDNPEKAITLAEQYLTGEARDQIYSTAIRRLCESNPEAARDAFVQLDTSSQDAFTAAEVARALAGQDMQSAVAWADTLPDGASRDAAVSLINRLTTQVAQ